MTLPQDGGCLCGAVRYRVAAAPVRAGYCHCRMCQRNSGAPVQAWADVPIDGFSLLKGEPASYRSSSWGQRQFCRTCGTPLLHVEIEAPRTVSIYTATLDDPASMPPTHHIWTASRVPWFETADDLPRYPEGRPSS